MSAEKEDVNLIEFLKKINISDKAIEILQNRNVTIDELMEMDNDDLKSFLLEELKLDALSKNRMIKSITKLKEKDNNTKRITTAKQHVVVSPDEHNGIIKLYERYDKSSQLSTNIQNAIQSLNECEIITNKQIEHTIDTIINNIKNKKNSLLIDIDTMLNYKTNLLKQQLNTITNYLTIVDNGKLNYDEYINKNMDITQRKKIILKMINDILNKKDIAIVMLTEPKIQFNIEYQLKKINKLYQFMQVNDCDQPKKIKISLKKVYDDMIYIQYELDEYDVNGPKKILEIVLEYAIIPKSYLTKKKKKKSKKHKRKGKGKKKKKRYDSDDDSDEESDSKCSEISDSESDNYSDNNSDIEYEYDMNEIDINTLKWQHNKTKIKYKSGHLKHKYKVEGLKESKVYLIRMKARNSSGFGIYSDLIDVTTKNAKIKFDKYNKMYVTIHKKGHNVRILGGGSSGCIYTVIQSSRGFKSGIKKWKIKIDNTLQFDTDMEQVGVVSQILKQHQLTNVQITQLGHSVGSGTGLRPGDLIEITLDFKKLKIVIKKNGSMCKQQDLVKGNTYYPVIQCCVCRHQSYTLLKK